MTATLQSYHRPAQYEQLLAEVDHHEVQILHEDGLYRHLRFARPGTSLWHWDLITWPGSLAIRGDIGEGFIFTRDSDMLDFFDDGQPDGHINVGYWAEKLDRGSRSVRTFSEDRFRTWLSNHHQVGGEQCEGLLDEAGYVLSVEQAVEMLDANGIAWDCDDPESWKDYDHHFLLALHAILWGAKRYHAAKVETQPGDPCTGAGDCAAARHDHGCFADVDGSRYDDPDDHAQSGDRESGR